MRDRRSVACPGDVRRDHVLPDPRLGRRAHQVLCRADLHGDLPVHLQLSAGRAHWCGTGRGRTRTPDASKVEGIEISSAGYIWQMGALDFAGGTVVHINAGVAGLIGAFLVGKRLGYGREVIRPHSLTMTMIGASMLWFGWFGFNAGSGALEANASAALAFLNTYLTTACAVLAWTFAEWILKGKPSMLGAASGAVAGLVAITPPAANWRNVGIPGAFAMGLAAGVVCLWGVTGLKKLLKADDSLDVFGVHAVGGITGALLTGIFNSPDLGGPGSVQDWVTMTNGYPGIAAQLWIQAKAVGITVVWTGVVALLIGLQGRRSSCRSSRHRRAGTRRPGHQLARRVRLRLLNAAGADVAGVSRSFRLAAGRVC